MDAPTFDTDAWHVREPRVDLQSLAVTESVFSLSNGYLGVRGTLDEVEPFGMRGSYLSGVHETHPLSYPEGGYGHPDEGQALLTVLDGTPLRLLVDGIPLDVREVEPEVHERTLDLRAGTLDRCVRWTAQSGTTMEVRSRRLVSLAERSVCAVRYEVRALDVPAHVVVRSELAGGEITPTGVDNDDPRVREALDRADEPLLHVRADAGGALAGTDRARPSRSPSSVDRLSHRPVADDKSATQVRAKGGRRPSRSDAAGALGAGRSRADARRGAGGGGDVRAEPPTAPSVVSGPSARLEHVARASRDRAPFHGSTPSAWGV